MKLSSNPIFEGLHAARRWQQGAGSKAKYVLPGHSTEGANLGRRVVMLSSLAKSVS